MATEKKEPKKKKEAGPTGPSLFDWVNAICVTGVAPTDTADKSYNQFMLNRALAQNIDTVLIANTMNEATGLTNQQHYDCLVRMVAKKKRYGKWAKSDEKADDAIQTISTYYKCRHDVAERYASILTPDQIAVIRTRIETGGAAKGR